VARTIRIERAGAWYHVTARGNERRAIYRDLVFYLGKRGLGIKPAEMNPQAAICTVDSQFRFFRKNARYPLSLIAPFAS